ncbi:MAG: SDR family NAD(P)-dependent oxidoreductase [Calditrichaeota bacterium]|nr:SDR family NAD(P)-dependent oxidoreductase [Calditrichota bacterium]MCB0269250.1 SDR family NAD(P)-dependent oxidoreductase [Calditrichota bacterium]
MAYFVTGAAGFIGSKVAEKLLDRGEKVVGIDNMNDYYDVRVKQWRLQHLQKNSRFQFVQGDIGDLELLKNIFNEHQFDAVFNLAARAGVRASVADPWVYYQTNVTGTLNLLECCRQKGIRKFILASTSSVYGETETPFNVGNKTDTPLSPYAASKKGAEALCYSYHYLYKIDVSIPRYFTVYGPAGRPDMSYFKFLLKIDRGLPIDIYGDGKQKRDFTFVDDVAEATVRCLDLSGYNIFNVGNDRPVELHQMITLLEKLMGKSANKNYMDRHPADNPVTWANLDQTLQLLNWRPQVPLEDGLKKVCDWFAENKVWLREIDLTD